MFVVRVWRWTDSATRWTDSISSQHTQFECWRSTAMGQAHPQRLSASPPTQMVSNTHTNTYTPADRLINIIYWDKGMCFRKRNTSKKGLFNEILFKSSAGPSYFMSKSFSLSLASVSIWRCNCSRDFLFCPALAFNICCSKILLCTEIRKYVGPFLSYLFSGLQMLHLSERGCNANVKYPFEFHFSFCVS